MTSCPRCFHLLDPDTRFYQCPGPCEAYVDPAASAYRGIPVTGFPGQLWERQGERNWNPPASIPCHKCHRPTREACPTCRFPLPPDWREGTAICIALAGARATGKSVYIAVLVKQLEQMLHSMGSLLSFATAEGRRSYAENYEAHLYQSRAILQATASSETETAYQAIPLIISLGLIKGVRRYLVLRDAAGEELERADGDAVHLSYFQRAHAVFFLFDPSAVPSVRELLRGLIPEQLMKPGDPQRVLLTLLTILGGASPPIAMILSKFDTLQSLRVHEDQTWSAIMANAGAAFQRDPGIFEPRYDPVDGQLLHLETRSLLQLLHAQGFVNAMSDPQRGRPYEHQYFAVSALGGPASGEALHPHGIAPFRCLDPIRWVLNRQGVL
jgi:hypothetical protein